MLSTVSILVKGDVDKLDFLIIVYILDTLAEHNKQTRITRN